MMAYDRYDTRDMPRDERSQWRDEGSREGRNSDSERTSRSRRDDRGFFERAGDEIASWFGDEDSGRRGHGHPPGNHEGERSSSGRSRNGDRNQDRGYDRDPRRPLENDARRSDAFDDERSAFSAQRGREGNFERGGNDRRGNQSSGPRESRNENRGVFARGGSSEGDYDRNWRQEYSGADFNRGEADRELDRGWTDRYRPITGDYGRGGPGSPDRQDELERSQSKWAQDEYRATSRAGSANWSDRSRDDRSDRSRDERFDPHYQSWRDRHISELDRDYDDYRAENRSRFESDFGSWRERRQEKRGILARIQEQMEVVGNDQKHVGTVERTSGDRLVLSKSDAASGGMHHSISCSDIDKIDGDRVVLACSAEEARELWRDESRGRALFEGDDQGEMGPRMLNRSFDGTYR